MEYRNKNEEELARRTYPHPLEGHNPDYTFFVPGKDGKLERIRVKRSSFYQLDPKLKKIKPEIPSELEKKVERHFELSDGKLKIIKDRAQLYSDRFIPKKRNGEK